MAELSFVEARNLAITEAMNADERVILIGDPGGAGAPAGGFARSFGPSRVRRVPISEEGFGGVGVGASLFGLRPIVSFVNASFFFDAWEPALNEAALLRAMSGAQFSCPIVFHFTIRLRTGWAAQHSQTSTAMLVNAPGLVVVAPGTPAGAYELMHTALASGDPVVYVESGAAYGSVEEVAAGQSARPARARVLRTGGDVTLVAVSGTVPAALAVADRLAAEGVSVEVLDPQVLSPLDRAGIAASVARTGRLVAAEEGQLSCGVAAEIVASAVEAGHGLLKAPPRRVAIPDVPISPGPTQIAAILPSEARIEAAIRAVLV
jgi:pyruvate/2-oxoglutarate/acetoin dehydrogenase E1 component